MKKPGLVFAGHAHGPSMLEDGMARRSTPAIETEASHGPENQAWHARFGRTNRSAVMFGPPGFSYLYMITVAPVEKTP